MADAERERARSPIDGNRLTSMPDGPERLDALIALIDGAKTSLRLLYYIYTADRSGALVRDALLRAIDRGVDVSLLIDGFGSSDTPRELFPRAAASAARRFCRFNPS